MNKHEELKAKTKQFHELAHKGISIYFKTYITKGHGRLYLTGKFAQSFFSLKNINKTILKEDTQ